MSPLPQQVVVLLPDDESVGGLLDPAGGYEADGFVVRNRFTREIKPLLAKWPRPDHGRWMIRLRLRWKNGAFRLEKTE
ncbi:MAG: hypothetical protein MUF04_10655 [Akkermansiaceae bacterium]|jgi:hypothetical protein|nr:hypothetical protein [Akkermansiaceae bacterium]